MTPAVNATVAEFLEFVERLKEEAADQILRGGELGQGDEVLGSDIDLIDLNAWMQEQVNQYIAELEEEESSLLVEAYEDGVLRAYDDVGDEYEDETGIGYGDWVEDFVGNSHELTTENVFCKTGPGGGIDPTCSTGVSTAPSLEGRRYETKDVPKYIDSTKISRGIVLDEGVAKDGTQVYRWDDEKANKSGVWTSSKEQAQKEGKEVANSKKVVKPTKGFGDKWLSGLSEKEKESLEDYSNQSDKINSGLRTGMSSGNLDMDAAISRSIIPTPITVYRGLTSDLGVKVGDIFYDKAYVSTTGSRTIAEEFMTAHGNLKSSEGSIMEIKIPKGAKGADMNGLSTSYGSEGEILLPRGSKFTITGIREEDGVRIYEVSHVTN